MDAEGLARLLIAPEVSPRLRRQISARINAKVNALYFASVRETITSEFFEEWQREPTSDESLRRLFATLDPRDAAIWLERVS